MADRRGSSVERYYASKKKRNKARKVRLYTTLTLVSIAIFILLSLTVFFNIRTFRVQGNSVYSAKEIVAAAGLKEGDNLFRLNKFKIAEKLSITLPYVGKVEIYRKLPTTLCIDVTETKASLVAYKDGKYILLNDQMKVLEIKEELPENVTYLIGAKFEVSEVGKTVSFSDKTTEDLMEHITAELQDHMDREKVSAIDVSEQYALRLYYDNHRVKILLGNSENLGEKFEMCQQVIAQNSPTDICRIDAADATAVYYRVLEQAEIDDLKKMLKGEAKAKPDKIFNKTEPAESEEDETEETEENEA